MKVYYLEEQGIEAGNLREWRSSRWQKLKSENNIQGKKQQGVGFPERWRSQQYKIKI